VRFWHAMVLRALLVLAALALLAPASAGAAARPPAKALLVDCERGAEPAGTFEGEMRTMPGASRMQMRFKLQVRTPQRDRWTALAAPGFGSWVTSDAGTSRYVYTKRVENMVGPGSYRVQIRFRWLDAAGDVVATARAYTRRCRQPDPRANLVVEDIGVEPGADPSRSSYVVLVSNTGRSDAEPSSLSLRVGAEALPAAPVAALAPDEYTLVTFEGPACAPGAPLVAIADAAEAVDERSERDNRLRALCA
jgi:hypothetical protein